MNASGAEYIDASDWITDLSLFEDVVHLTPQGATLLFTAFGDGTGPTAKYCCGDNSPIGEYSGQTSINALKRVMNLWAKLVVWMLRTAKPIQATFPMTNGPLSLRT